MKAETFLSLLEKMGIQSSFSRPRVSGSTGTVLLLPKQQKNEIANVMAL